jgi:putative peptidoglycan lipid II flippase
MLPRLSSLATARDTEGVKRFVSLGLRVAWAATIPVTAVVLALAQPIVSLLFQRGAFDQDAASLTAMVLSMYMVGFTFLVMLRILLSTFYAFQDTKTPFGIRVGMLGLNLTADLILLPVLGVLGLALATSFTYAVNCIPAAWFLRKRIGPLRLSINRYLAKTVAAALAMATVAWALHGQLHQMMGGATFLRQLLAVGVSTLAGGIVYLVALILLRLEELRTFLEPLRARLPLGHH